jgi:hypothetical protein
MGEALSLLSDTIPFPTISGFLLKGKATLDLDARGGEIGRGGRFGGWAVVTMNEPSSTSPSSGEDVKTLLGGRAPSGEFDAGRFEGVWCMVHVGVRKKRLAK